ncbi:MULTISPECIES: hypothetical protein, partial [unclassified Endozoicomonas]|uniref:hypothetical protein n=1 Tax=unclassified Endozoicomonas TaxID=2644528 RepID=UPI0021485269
MTRCFIFELKQDSDSLKQNFSINRDWHTLSVNLSDIAQIDDYAERDLAPDKKRHRTFNYGIQKTIIESISWQWLYATNLLIAYELILTTKQFPTSDTPYLWLPTEVVAAVDWFLKNYCVPDTQLFNPIEQQANQDHPFATIITVFGSGNNPPQYQSSESFSQQAPQATLSPISSLIRPLNNDYSGGNGGYQQQQHTLGLNCFIHPCYGFCRFRRPPSGSSGPAERPLNTSESSGSHLATGQCFSCVGHYDPANSMKLRQNPLFKTLNDLSDIQLPFDSDPLIDGIDGHLTDSIQNAIEAIGLLDDDVPMLNHLSSIADDFEAIDGSLDPESLLKEDEVAFTLNHSETQQTTSKSSHLDQSQPQLSRAGAAQAKADSGQRTCAVSAVGKDGQSRACRKVCNNAQALFDHKIKDHGKQQICEVIVVGEDRQQRPCGKVCRNAIALMIQKRQEHSGQKVCEVIVAGEHGQQGPCGRVYKSAASLSSHKSGYHS